MSKLTGRMMRTVAVLAIMALCAPGCRSQSEKGTKTASEAAPPAKPADVSTAPPKGIVMAPPLSGLDQFYKPGSDVRVVIPPKAAKATRWQWLDYDGKEMASGKVEGPAISLGAVMREGFYRVVFCEDDKEIGYTGVFVRSPVAAADRPKNIALEIGMSRFWSNELVEKMADVFPYTGAGMARSRNFWRLNEPKKGDRLQSRWQEIHKRFADKGVDLSIYSVESPGFANASGKDAILLPSNLRDVYDFCKWIPAQWPAAVKLYHTWNEPDLTGNGTGARSASYVKALSLAVRSVRPDILITTPSPATSSLENWFAEMLANDLYPYVDYYAIHHHTSIKKAGTTQLGASVFETGVMTEPTLEPAEADRSHAIRDREDSLDYMYQRYATHAKHAKGLPAVCTEGGVMANAKPITWEAEKEQGAAIPAYLATSLHLGLKMHQYFMAAPASGDCLPWNLLQAADVDMNDQSPRAGLYAFSVAAAFLADAKPMGRFSAPGAPSARILVFESGSKAYAGKAVIVFWDMYSGKASLPAFSSPAAVEIYDHMNRKVSGPEGRVVSWPPKYALAPLEEARKLTLKNEAVFANEKSGKRTPSPLVMDICLPETQFTVRPVSGIRLNAPRIEAPLKLYNFSDQEKTYALTTQVDGIAVELERTSVTLKPQSDLTIKAVLSAPADFFTSARSFASSRQVITASAGEEKSILAFNVFADPAMLPVSFRKPVEAFKDVSNYFQMNHEKGERGTASFVPVDNGMRIDFEYAKGFGLVASYVRCKLNAPPPAQVDAIGLTVTLNQGGGGFRLILSDGKNAYWLTVIGHLSEAGSSMKVVIPLRYFYGPKDFELGEARELHWLIVDVGRSLSFTVTDMEWLKLK